jgi:heat shock protein beta
MDIIINSLYSDRDVFLRELVSNAADACDKKRFLSLTSEETVVNPEITVQCFPEENKLVISDTGVGMTRDELVNNLGKIAQSGTKAFVEALGKGNADVNLIGQFGVGFYSAFLVSEKVEVVTKSMQPGSPQLRWTSEAGSSYTIVEDNEDPMETSGTRLILYLKEDATDYIESSKIEDLLQRYSEFIEFPISLWKETTEYKKVPDVEANKDLPEGEEPKMKTVPETRASFERVNTQKPVWLRSPKDVTEEEYQDFYKGAFRNSYDSPMKYSHFVLEGQVECKAILYIPGMLPFDLSKDMFDENARNIRLYVKRVFINDKFEGLMPRWLKFVRGVVDSNDLPLNVSREILQKSKVLSIINKRLVRKSLDMIREIADEEDESKYIMFWNNFGKYLKVGVIEDDKNKEEIEPLLRFFSSKSGEEYTSFEKYVENMAEGQKQIYYVTGEGREKASMSPVLEKLTSRGYEVLFATEPLDEITFEAIRQYKDFDVVDAAKETIKIDDDEDASKKKEQAAEELKPTMEYLETLLAGKVQKVTVSTLLVDSPAALVQGAYGVSPTMQRYMKAQAVASGADESVLMGMNQAVLEINPNHPLVKELDRRIKAGQRESPETEDFALLMYDVACMTSGYDVKDVKGFAKRVMKSMAEGIEAGIPDAVVEEPVATDKTEEDKPVEAEVVEEKDNFQ